MQSVVPDLALRKVPKLVNEVLCSIGPVQCSDAYDFIILTDLKMSKDIFQ